MGLLNALTRRKPLTSVLQESSQLNRVLSTYDLIALGVGCTLGVGVYVLPGVVAKEIAGPGVVLSFFYAAVASVLAGLCYAEFGARVPKAGSAYVYSYVTVGEFVAFIIGWNLIIEYIIGAASVARGASLYLDSFTDNTMSKFFLDLYPLHYSFLSEYIDFFAFAVSVIVCLCLATGLKESVILNNLLTSVNCAIVVFVIICGGMYIDFNNWKLPASTIPVGYGTGGFLPYGLLGTFKGAATCFYGFVGFDVIATSGEEARNPRFAIPMAIIISLFISFIAYSGLSSVLTLMWPYYLQDVDAPIPFVFAELGLNWAKWIVTIGGLFGLSSSLVAGLFPLPRVIYAMAQDGLMFEFMGKVHSKFKTPFIGTIISGVVTGAMAAVIPLKNLVDLMSMATLACYTIVAMSVLILRYRQEGDMIEGGPSEATPLLGSRRASQESRFDPSKRPFTHVPTMVYVLTLACGVLAYAVVHLEDMPKGTDPSLWPFFCVQLLIVIALILVCFQGMAFGTSTVTFQMPGLPVTPTLSIFFNLYLMVLMDFTTWTHFILWSVAGFLIYFCYGLRHSKENKTPLSVSYEEIGDNEKIQT